MAFSHHASQYPTTTFKLMYTFLSIAQISLICELAVQYFWELTLPKLRNQT